MNYGASAHMDGSIGVSLRSQLARIEELTDEQLAELRDDPTLAPILRRLAPADVIAQVTLNTEEFVTKMEEAKGIAEAAAPDARNLDFYRARAFALGLRQ